MPSIKGTASVSDDRALQKLLRCTKFPSNFNQKVDYSKIHQPIIKKWISDRITQLLGFEDDIVQSTAINLFLPSSSVAAATSIGTASTSDTSGTHCSSVDPRKAQLDLQGFLGEAEAAEFSRELWTLLLEAQVSPNGVPRAILEQKKRELLWQQQTRQAAGAVAGVAAATATVDVARMVQEATRRAEAVRQALVKSHPSNSVTAAAAAPPPPPTSSSSSRVGTRQQHSWKQPNSSVPPCYNSSMSYPPQPKEEAVRVEKCSSADKVHNGRDYSTNANGTDDDTTTVISSRSRASRSSSRSNTNNIDNSTEEEEERRRRRKKRKKSERKESRRSRRTRSVSPPAIATGTYKRAYRHEDDDDYYYYEKKRNRRYSTSDDSTNGKHGSGGNNDYKITEKRKKSSSSHRRRHHDRYSSKDRESTTNRRRS
jgi:serine/arginine repetitive matrix protein 1